MDRIPKRKKTEVRLDCEHQQQSHEEREDPQSFGKGQTDEQGRSLRRCCRRVAQGARQKVAGHMTNTDSRCARTDGGQAGTDELTHLCDVTFHDILLKMEQVR